MKRLKRGCMKGMRVIAPRLFSSLLVLVLTFQPVGGALTVTYAIADDGAGVTSDVLTTAPDTNVTTVASSEEKEIPVVEPADTQGKEVVSEPESAEVSSDAFKDEANVSAVEPEETPTVPESASIETSVVETQIQPETTTGDTDATGGDISVPDGVTEISDPMSQPENISGNNGLVISVEDTKSQPASADTSRIENGFPVMVSDGKVCLEKGFSEKSDSVSNWNIGGNIAATRDKVEIGVRYEFPLDKEVSLVFSCLPENESDRSLLQIEKIKISDIDLPEGTIAVSEYAYDITTDGMENGTFTYDLTLPTFKGIKNANVSYIEMSVDDVTSKEIGEKDIRQVEDKNIDNGSGFVQASGIDHFTIMFPSVGVVCQNDVNGANDVSGQKDLTMMCRTTDNSSSIFTKWNWDDISWTGNNTGDACNLFDTDGDGKINYAVCVTIGNDPAVIQNTTRYSCGDNKPDRCTSPATALSVSPSTACEVNINNNDPFSAGNAYPSDTEAVCSIALSDVGGITTSKLIDVCSYPSQQPNSDPSDCIIATQAQTGKFEVVKKLIPTNDAGLFDLSIDGAVSVSGVGNNGTTGEQVVLTGNHTFGEAGSGATDLSDYTATVSCKDANGTGAAVSVTGSNPWTLNVSKDKDIVCIITNTLRSSTLILTKDVVNDNGGTKVADDFPVFIDGQASFWGLHTVQAGTYAVSEDSLLGYAPSLWGGDCTENGSVTLLPGETKTCTVTNDDIAPSLTLVKQVANDNGGILDGSAWTLSATGPTSFSGFGGPSVSNGPSFDAGTYTLTESGPDGYAPSNWVCVGTGNQTGSNAISLELGQSATCTIVNNDIVPSLVLVKHVVNDNGGDASTTDWTLSADGPTPISGAGGTASGEGFDAGTYTLSESAGPFGYDPSSWSCVKNNNAPVAGSSIAVGLGDVVVCSITNDDIAPTIRLNKSVINNDGGTAGVNDFGLSVGGTPVTSGQILEVSSNTPIVLNETGLPGYAFVSITGDAKCPSTLGGTVSLDEGENIVCTITNDDTFGRIIVEKQTLPDGDQQSFSFLASYDQDGFTLSDGQQNVSDPLVAGTYSVSESVAVGWDLTSVVCSDGSPAERISLQENETVTCVFTNTKRGHITVVKNAINNNAQDFTFNNNFGNGNPVVFSLDDDSNATLLNNRTFEVLPGVYAVTEDPVAGWQQESAVCDNGETTESIDVAPGETVTCTFTNEQYAKIALVKNTVGGDGTFDFDATGAGLPEDIDLTTVAGTSNQTFSDLDQDNTYSLVENVPDGWDLTGAVCSGTNAPASITPDPGETVTCTFTNSKRPTLTLEKTIVTDNGGSAVDIDWTLTATGPMTISGTEGDVAITNAIVDPGTYNLSESDGPSGYVASQYVCVKNGNEDVSGNSIVLNYGDDVVCTITNDDIAPILHLRKEISGGSATVDDFLLTADGTELNDISGMSPVDSGQSLKADTFALSEAGLSGYTASDWVCEGGVQYGSNITLGIDEEATCTILNTRDAGSITVRKVIDEDGDLNTVEDQTLGVGWEFDVNGSGGDTSDPLPGLTDESGFVSFSSLNTGEYFVAETVQDGYELVSASCNNESGNVDGNILYSVDVTKDNDTVCTFYNTPNGSIHGYKWNDLDSDGKAGEGENRLPGWMIDLYESDGEGYTIVKSMVTDGGEEHLGWYWFDHLFPGDYKICERLQAGWQQTYPDNEGGACHFVTLPNNDSQTENAVFAPEYNFGNEFIPPVLQIQKSNNSVAPQRPGDEVTYTIIVTAPSDNMTPVEDVQVTDLPPAGFVYVPGSGVASQGLLTHVYASPGIWSLGTMNPGDVVTLSYSVTIDGGQDAGTYDDIAFAKGTSVVDETVLANSSETVPFVGTQVAVDLPQDPASVSLSSIVDRQVDHKTEHRVRRVLGAVLPEAGTPTGWLVAALFMVSGGMTLALWASRRRMKTLFTQKFRNTALRVAVGLMIGGWMAVVGGSPVYAASNVSVQIETPESQVNSPDFQIGFVALDILGRSVSVECFKKGPADGSFSSFAIYGLIDGGSSGNCVVDASVMPMDGLYRFHVVATTAGGSESVTSDDVSAELLSTNVPGTPTQYVRNTVSPCVNQVTFVTADDGGKTVKVELYRSVSSNFTADASTKVQEVAMTSNQNESMTDTVSDCGATYFYAIRAVSTTGDGSGFIGDTTVTIERETKRRVSTTTKKIATVNPAGAIEVASPGAVSEGSVTQTDTSSASVEGAVTDESRDDNSKVLGEEAEFDDAEDTSSWFKRFGIWILVVGAAMSLIWYVFSGRREN